MKLAVIGGGGVRSIFLAKSLTQNAKSLGLKEIVFMDKSEEKLSIYGQMAYQVARRVDPDIKFSLSNSSKEAVLNADYVITTIRVGEDQKRVDDEKIALAHGVIGQETTGAAGFSFAMRSIPALAEYCELIRKYAKPAAKMFNFTNPAGVVSQALRDMGYDFTFGICDAPSGLFSGFSKVLGVDVQRLSGTCFGLNHLSFFNSIKLDGREILNELIENDRIYTETEMKFFSKRFTKNMGMILNEYLYYYFYPEKAYANIMRSSETRGELIRDINIKMTDDLAQINIEQDFERAVEIYEKWYGKRELSYMKNETMIAGEKPSFKFDFREKDEGGYAGVALKYIETEKKSVDGATEMVLCVPNHGAIPFLNDTDVVEISCVINKGVCTPKKIEGACVFSEELIRRVKSYERLAAKAIIEKDKKSGVLCLALHPLVNSFSVAESLMDAYLKSNSDFITEWK